MVKIFLAVGFQ